VTAPVPIEGEPVTTLSTRSAAVRGSAIRDLLTLTASADVLGLAGGLPAADLLPRERVAEAAGAALTDPASLQYGETAGLARLREVLAEHESRRCGRTVAGVVVTTGSHLREAVRRLAISAT
jgi:2-aminoadipate transaminase